MNKKDLIANIAEKASLTFTQAEEAFNATFLAIQDAMLAQENVAIAGFGSFGTKVRAERKVAIQKQGKRSQLLKQLFRVLKQDQI